MKWVAVGLLLGNVVFFGWHLTTHIRESVNTTEGVPDLPARTPSLRLLSELSELPVRRDTAVDGVSPTQNDGNENSVVEAVDLNTELNEIGDPSDICIGIGPITKGEQLANIKAWLRERATTVHTRREVVRERRFFWVYLVSTSDAEALQNLDDLGRRGVTDYMLVRRGDQNDTISLGFFRSQESVNRRLAEMNQKGYRPVVVPKFEMTEHYFIRATLALGQEDTVDFPRDYLDEADLEEGSCAAI